MSKFVLVYTLSGVEAQSYFGGVSGNKHIIAKCRHQFTIQFPNEAVIAEAELEVSGWDEVDDYFKKNYTEYYIAFAFINIMIFSFTGISIPVA